MSDCSKILYTAIADRMSLSIQNNWKDKNNEIYVIFTNEELSNILYKSIPTIIKAKKELKEYGLIKEKRQGLNKPNLLYIRNLKSLNSKNKTYLNQNVKTFKPNKTDIINTDIIKTTTKEKNQKSVVVDKKYLDNFILQFKKLYQADFDREELIKLYIEKGENILNYYLEKFNVFLENSTKDIKNIASFFNYIVSNEKHIPVIYKSNINKLHKPIQENNYEQRQYNDEYFDSLYDNVKYINQEE